MTTTELQDLFFKEIPVSGKMGIQVLIVTSNEIQIKVSLSENKNHKGTAFGGSQYSVCALACYGLFLSSIREFGHNTNNIVIANGSIKYLAPVTTDFVVSASWNPEEKKHFFNMLSEKKKSKVNLVANILEPQNSEIKSVFNGEFVAFL